MIEHRDAQGLEVGQGLARKLTVDPDVAVAEFDRLAWQADDALDVGLTRINRAAEDGQAKEEKQGKEDASKERAQEKQPPVPESASLRVEVLGDPAKTKDRHFYRVEGGLLLNLQEVRERLAQRRKQELPLQKVVIVLYEDSPDKDNPIVRDLVDLVRGDGLTPDISEPPGKAP